MMNKYDQQAALISAKKEGVEEGVNIGDARSVLRTAKRMKAKGLNTALIAEITGLSEREIEELDTTPLAT